MTLGSTISTPTSHEALHPETEMEGDSNSDLK